MRDPIWSSEIVFPVFKKHISNIYVYIYCIYIHVLYIFEMYTSVEYSQVTLADRDAVVRVY